MKIFIWENLEKASENYHSEGGIVIVAKDLEDARNYARQKTIPDYGNKLMSPVPDDCDIYTTDPTHVYELKDFEIDPTTPGIQNKVFVFPNAGCC